MKDQEKKPEMIIHDRDAKFTKKFTKTVKDVGVNTNPLPKGSPNMNGRCERLIEMIKLECLRNCILFGEQHLVHWITELVTYYNTRRSHMQRDHLSPIRDLPEEVETLRLDQIQVNFVRRRAREIVGTEGGVTTSAKAIFDSKSLPSLIFLVWRNCHNAPTNRPSITV